MPGPPKDGPDPREHRHAQDHPCLWFDTEGEQAAELYTRVFPNSAVNEGSRHGPDGPREEGSVMTVAFTLDGQDYVALNGGPDFHFSEAISFQIDCASQEEVDHYWDALSEGGRKARAAG